MIGGDANCRYAGAINWSGSDDAIWMMRNDDDGTRNHLIMPDGIQGGIKDIGVADPVIPLSSNACILIGQYSHEI